MTKIKNSALLRPQAIKIMLKNKFKHEPSVEKWVGIDEKGETVTVKVTEKGFELITSYGIKISKFSTAVEAADHAALLLKYGTNAGFTNGSVKKIKAAGFTYEDYCYVSKWHKNINSEFGLIILSNGTTKELGKKFDKNKGKFIVEYGDRERKVFADELKAVKFAISLTGAE